MPAKKRTAPAKKEPIHAVPGFVAECVRYERFVFPGEPLRVIPAESIPDLLEMIQFYAGMIDPRGKEERAIGLPEVFAKTLAQKLVQWLASRAAEGSDHAQAALVDISREAVGWHSWSLNQGHEKTIQRAKLCPEIPGWISLNPEHTAYWQTKLEEIGQGSETPVPMKLGEKEKRSRRDITHGKHLLVSALFDYMSAHRRNSYLKAFEIPHDHPEIPARIREILELEDFTAAPAVVKAWHKVGYEIVKDATGKDPENHEAFKRPPLKVMNGNNVKSPISTGLRKGWEALAREKSRI